MENKLLDIIFTNDGKEYVTTQHLGNEIRDELYIHGGKVSLVDLAQTLNVGLSQVTKIVTEIEKHNKELKVILGQLIDKSYIDKIAEEINDKLVQHGCISVAELTFAYDLPAEFLQSIVEKELGKIIHATQDSQDPKVFYTESFVATNRAKIRGALSAVTKPTPLSAILGQCAIPERIFFCKYHIVSSESSVDKFNVESCFYAVKMCFIRWVMNSVVLFAPTLYRAREHV